MSDLSRIRVLLIAEAANPEWVSVPLEGWSHSRAIAELVDGHLVTQVRNREAIIRAGLDERAFTAIDSERIARRVHRLGTMLRGGNGKGWTTITALGSLSYAYFERCVWRAFGGRIEAGEFDLVHRLTPLSPTIPSGLARKCRRASVPFVLGPLNGGVSWPRGFDDRRRAEREWLSYLRGAHRLLPGYRATREHASAIIIGSRDTYCQMPARYHHKCIYIPENAVDPARFTVMRERRAARPIRIVFLGRLVPYKGADMLLEAAAPLLRSGAATLRLLGDGPQMPLLREMVRELEIERSVELRGWVEHAQVQRELVECDVFAFPSIREFGGAVVLEAMAVGLMPLIVGYGGPAELVTDRTGMAVPIGSREEIVGAFRRALERLAAEPELIDERAAAARHRVRTHFTWQAKARQVMEVYEWVLGRREEKPDFGMPLGDEVIVEPRCGAERSHDGAERCPKPPRQRSAAPRG